MYIYIDVNNLSVDLYVDSVVHPTAQVAFVHPQV